MYFAFCEKTEGVHGEVGLQEAAVRLGLDQGKLDLLGRHAQVEPGGHLGYFQVGVGAEEQLGHDLLRPGRARLGVGRDHDVVVAEFEIVPDRGVEVVVVHLAGLRRPNDRFGHVSCFSSCLSIDCSDQVCRRYVWRTIHTAGTLLEHSRYSGGVLLSPALGAAGMLAVWRRGDPETDHPGKTLRSGRGSGGCARPQALRKKSSRAVPG